MSLLENIVSAFRSVFANKMRSILTMLGIIIGISSVILITSLGKGFREYINNQFNKFGLNSFTISLKERPEKSSDNLTIEDLETLKNMSEIKYATPIFRDFGIKIPVPYSQEKITGALNGATDELRYVLDLEIKHGRYLIPQDINYNSKVAVIDENLSKKLFGIENSLGMKFKIEKDNELPVEYEVIGIVKYEFGAPTLIYIPYTNFLEKKEDKNISTFFIRTDGSLSVEETQNKIQKILSLTHNNSNKYNVESVASQISIINTILDVITYGIAFIAGISLLVGGVGVMNIMLVTVTERTREIGIRKSLGATKGQIQFQFLVEAIILTAIGGIIGMLLGYYGALGVSALVKKFFSTIEIIPYFSLTNILVVLGVSSFTGIIFGVYPASKAAKLDPIEALRFE